MRRSSIVAGLLALIGCLDALEPGSERGGSRDDVGSDAGPGSGAEGGSHGEGDAAPDAPACGHAGESCCADQLCEGGLVCSSSQGGTCRSALTAAACAPGAPPLAFVSETAPPAAMGPYDRFTMLVTYRNCSGATIPRVDTASPTGLKLGFSAPRDSEIFGGSRFALPIDVPNAMDVTIPITVRAPPLTGTYYLGYDLVDEGRAWLETPTTPHVLTVVTPASAKTVTLCAGVSADANGSTSATAALQACIDQTPEGGTLELPPGVYRVDGQLTLGKPMTLRTAGTTAGSPSCWEPGATPCAVLRASEGLSAPRGFFYVSSPSGLHVDRIVLDGNRNERLSSPAAATCAGGTNGAGFNAHSDDCASCSMRRSVSARALCGTGWEWTGDAAKIESNAFVMNGDHTKKMMWSDGLTLLRSNGATVRGNTFLDNSDVDLICGGADRATIEDNRVRHVLQASFAAVMLDNFNGGTPGSFVGAIVKGNQIDCGALLCDFGIELGPHPWYLSANIRGGTVTGNAVFGAKIQINAEGAGTAQAPVTVSGNLLGGAPASAVFGCGQTRSGAVFNVSPDSVVTTTDATANRSFHGCP